MLTLLLETIRDWVNDSFSKFQAMMLGYVTPQMYGAKGDGTTDDTLAIQHMFDSISAGKVVFFPKGIYVVSSSIVLKKTVSIKGEPMLTRVITTINDARPLSIIKYTGSANTSTITSDRWIELSIENMALVSDSYEQTFNTTQWTAPPYHVFNETITKENVNGIDLYGDSSLKQRSCLFTGFSGSATAIGQSEEVENCAFYKCKNGILEKKFDSKVKNCWFSHGGTAITTAYRTGEYFTSLSVNDTWCDQMREHFIDVKCDESNVLGYSTLLLVNDCWVDMIDESAIYVNGFISDSMITGRFSRCGMMYSNISEADRTDSIKEYSDVIVAHKIGNSYINVTVQKRTISHGDTSNNGICPAKVVSTIGNLIVDSTIECVDTLFSDTIDYRVSPMAIKNTRVITKDIDGIHEGWRLLKNYKITDSMPPADEGSNGKVVLFVGNSSTYAKGQTYECRAVAGSNPVTYRWEALIKCVTEVTTMPTASASSVGQTYLYTGNTTATYQKGGIYECQEVSPSTYQWVQIGVSMTQVTELVSAITSATDFADLQSRLQSYVQS